MGEEVALTDEIKEMIGKDFKAVVYEVEKGAIRKLAQAIEDPTPLWQDEEYAKKTKYGSIIAPPTFLTALRDEEWREWAINVKCPLKRALNAGNELELFQPIRAGDTMTVTTKLADAYERTGKTGKMLFMPFETSYVNQRGELIAKSRATFVKR